jgi:hypothetical protein
MGKASFAATDVASNATMKLRGGLMAKATGSQDQPSDEVPLRELQAMFERLHRVGKFLT